MFHLFKSGRRNELKERPFPPEWLAFLAEDVPYYARLSAEDQAELRGHIQIFLDEKAFEGCGGLRMTDEIRVTVAAQACLLLLHRNTDYYPDLESILVYPSTYVVHRTQRAPGGVEIEGDEARLGESWTRGAVVLAWDSVLRGAADVGDGHNVVLHEFAHQLDQETGEANGTPELPGKSSYSTWIKVLGGDYDALVAQVHELHKTDIDPYGTTSPAEFFAVVTETFFEKPKQLRKRHPALYEQLQLFYQQDPSTRFDERVEAPAA
jgi:hypothetical protein